MASTGKNGSPAFCNWMMRPSSAPKPALGYVPLYTASGLLTHTYNTLVHEVDPQAEPERAGLDLSKTLGAKLEEDKIKSLVLDAKGQVLGEKRDNLVYRKVKDADDVKVALIDKKGKVIDLESKKEIEDCKLVPLMYSFKMSAAPELISPPGRVIVVQQNADESKTTWQKVTATFQYPMQTFQDSFHVQACKKFFNGLKAVAHNALQEVAIKLAEKRQLLKLKFADNALPAWYNDSFGRMAPNRPPAEGKKQTFSESILLSAFCNVPWEQSAKYKNDGSTKETVLDYPGVHDVSSENASEYIFVPRDIPGVAAKDKKKKFVVCNDKKYAAPWSSVKKGDVLSAPWKLTGVTLMMKDGSADTVAAVYFNWTINEATIFPPEELWGAADLSASELPFVLDSDWQSDAEGKKNQDEFYIECATPIGVAAQKGAGKTKRKRSAKPKKDKEEKKDDDVIVPATPPHKPQKPKQGAPKKSKPAASARLIDDEAQEVDDDLSDLVDDDSDSDAQSDEVLPNPNNSDEDAKIFKKPRK